MKSDPLIVSMYAAVWVNNWNASRQGLVVKCGWVLPSCQSCTYKGGRVGYSI